jgi:Flp pilus assembly protein TadG
MRRTNQQRGSALLFTLLMSIVGASLLGVFADVAALLSVKARMQTAAVLAADAVSLERKAKPGLSEDDAKKVARASLEWNGFPGAEITLADDLKIRYAAEVFFLRTVRSEPIPVEARAAVRP